MTAMGATKFELSNNTSDFAASSACLWDRTSPLSVQFLIWLRDQTINFTIDKRELEPSYNLKQSRSY